MTFEELEAALDGVVPDRTGYEVTVEANHAASRYGGPERRRQVEWAVWLRPIHSDSWRVASSSAEGVLAEVRKHYGLQSEDVIGAVRS